MFIIIGSIVGAVIVMVPLAAWGYVAYLNHNLKSFNSDNSNRPADAAANAAGQRPMNILLMGSDTRSGKNGKLGTGSTADSSGFGNSDTEMILHVSANRKSAEVMSLPRDIFTNIPACKTSSGATYGAHWGQINGAYAIGGPACAQATAEAMTNIRMTHTLVIDFAGFEKIIDDVGGVTVCVPKAVDDTHGNIHLKAGTYTVKGKTALNYVRERQALGDGGDRSRITRQHAFISSLLKKLESNGTLTSPATLLSLAKDATSSLTVDKGLASVTKLAGLAEQLKGIPMANIKFLTVSTATYPTTAPNYATNKEHLVLNTTVADEEFASFRSDAPLPGTTTSPTATATAPAGKGVKVMVYNGTQTAGLAAGATKTLNGKGFKATTQMTSPGTFAKTVIEYGKGQKAHAQLVAAYFPGAKLTPTAGVTTIKVILGADYAKKAATPTVAPSSIATARSANTNICAGLEEGDA